MEQAVLHQQLARLNSEASALDARVEGVVAKMTEAAQGDKEGFAFHKDIYNNLVAKEKDINAMRAALTAGQMRLKTPLLTLTALTASGGLLMV